MKLLEIGAVLENEGLKLTIQGIQGTVYIVSQLFEGGTLELAALYTYEQLVEYDFIKEEPKKVAPAKDSILKVWEDDDDWCIRVSTGESDHTGRVICFTNGNRNGQTYQWKNWEVIQEATK